MCRSRRRKKEEGERQLEEVFFKCLRDTDRYRQRKKRKGKADRATWHAF